MARTLSANILTMIAEGTGERIHLLELQFSGGTLRWATSARPVLWNSQTWEAIGGHLLPGPIDESQDPRSQGTEIQLSGVDQTIISAALGQNYRGRKAKIYRAFIGTSGAVADVFLMFEGYLNEGFKITEMVTQDGQEAVKVTTRVVSKEVEMRQRRGIETNLHTHEIHYDGDLFFQHTPHLPGKKIVWGK